MPVPYGLLTTPVLSLPTAFITILLLLLLLYHRLPSDHRPYGIYISYFSPLVAAISNSIS